MPPLLIKLVFDRLQSAMPFLIRPIAKAISAGADKTFIGPQITLHLDFIETELASGPGSPAPTSPPPTSR